MKKSRILSACLAASLVASLCALPMGVSAEEAAPKVGWSLASENQEWLVYKPETSERVQPGTAGAELNAEAAGEGGMKISAVADAQGEPYKFVFVHVNVDLDEYPVLSLDVKDDGAANQLNCEMKITKALTEDKVGNIDGEQYVVLAPQKKAGHFEADVQKLAKDNNDENKAGEGNEDFWLCIAVFPNGGKGQWSGSYTIENLSFTSESSVVVPDSWQADFSKENLKNWATVNNAGSAQDTSLAAPDKALLKAEPYGKTGVKLNFQKKLEGIAWAYSSHTVTVNLDKSPKLFVELADLAENDDGIILYLDINGKRLDIADIKKDGKYEFDLTKPLTVSQSNPAETVTLSGEVTFVLNVVAMDYNQDMSTMIVKDLYIADKAKTGSGSTGGNPETGDAAPIAAVAVLAASGLVTLAALKKRRS